MMVSIVGYFLGIGVGISLGLMGGGGAILTIPIMIYFLGLGTQEAIATSLIVVGFVSLIGVIPHWYQGHICLKTAAMFGPPAMLGAYLGTKASSIPWVTDSIQLICFTLTAIFASILMICKQRQTPSLSRELYRKPMLHSRRFLNCIVIPAEGIGIGALTGFVGVGGGFAIVPTLVLLSGIPLKTAIGTSLLLIVLNSFTGFISYSNSIDLELTIVLWFTLFASVGTFIGVALNRYIHTPTLHKVFGYFILAILIFILIGNF